jgi:hypothetical protein
VAPPDPIEARWWRRFYAAVVVFALAYGLVEASSILMEADRDGVAVPLWFPLVNEVSGTLMLCALLPLIRWFDGLFPIRGDTWPVAVPAHVAFSFPLALIHIALFVAVRKLVYPVFDAEYVIGDIGFGLLYEYRKSAVGYVIVLIALYGFRHYVQLRRLLDMPDAHQRAEPVTDAPLESAPTTPADAVSPARRFLARRGDRDVIVNVSDIAWVEAAGNYVVLHTAVGELKLRETLSAMERELRPWDFVRVHRSHLVNLDAVKEVQPWFHGDRRLVLMDGTLLNLSRRYRDNLRRRMAPTPPVS